MDGCTKRLDVIYILFEAPEVLGLIIKKNMRPITYFEILSFRLFSIHFQSLRSFSFLDSTCFFLFTSFLAFSLFQISLKIFFLFFRYSAFFLHLFLGHFPISICQSSFLSSLFPLSIPSVFTSPFFIFCLCSLLTSFHFLFFFFLSLVFSFRLFLSFSPF